MMFADTAADIGSTTEWSWLMTLASVVKTPAPKKQHAANADVATDAANKPNWNRIIAIFLAFARTGRMMYSGMNAWPACTRGSPHNTVKEKRLAAIRCAAETVTPKELAMRICVV